MTSKIPSYMLAFLSVVSSAMVAAPQARADFQLNGGGATHVAPTSDTSGDPGKPTSGAQVLAAPSVVRGSAQGVPLGDAVKALVPPHIRVSFETPDLATRPVSFRGRGRTWDLVVIEALDSAGLRSELKDGTLYVSAPAAPTVVSDAPMSLLPDAGRAAAETGSAPRDGAGGSASLKQRSGQQTPSVASSPKPVAGAGPIPSAGVEQVEPAPVVTPVATAPLPPTWKVTAGSTLKTTLADWARDAGYTLLWNAKDDDGRVIDWPIEAGGLVYGEFEVALEDLLAGFDTADRHPVAAVSKKNHLLEMMVE